MSRFKKIASFFLSILILSSTVTVMFSYSPAEAATSLYGRAEYRGYFSGANTAGQAWADCPQGRGQLICGGISSTNINSFVEFYRGKLYSNNQQNNRASAFTILAMLGVSGPNSGGFTTGINRAKSRFSEWESIVRAYDAAGKINYNVNYSYSTNTAYRDGSYNNARDVQWYNDQDTARSIRFSIGNGKYVVIKRSCANMVGTLHTLPPPPETDWSLDPVVSTNSGGAAEPGSTVAITPSVDNSGSVDTTNNVNWQLTNFRVQPGSTVPNLNGSDDSYNSTQQPCTFFGGSGVSDCQSIASETRGFPVGDTTLSVNNSTIPDAPAGTKICFALSVQPRANDSSQWRHSRPVCLVIGKRPKVQVHGGDLLVGRTFSGQVSSGLSNVLTSTTLKNINGSNNTFGSWVEYGIFATGTIAGMASGSAYAAASGLPNAGACGISRLSFTNARSSSCSSSTPKGNYQTGSDIPDVAASFPVSSQTASLGRNPTVNLGAAGLQGLYTATGNVSVSGGNISAGRWIVLHAPSSTVTINGNITYAGGVLNSIEDIPQVIIIARNINISGSVSRVDAWLIASGSSGQGKINTCSSVSETADLTVSTCNQQLVVNGPVMARTLLLRRTAGSGTGNSSGDPAEIFNLRPDAYLWAMARASESDKAQTIYTTELPPRF